MAKNHDERKKDKKKKKDELNRQAIKITLVAGITLIATIVKNIIEEIIQSPVVANAMNVVYVILGIVLLVVAYKSTPFNEMIKQHEDAAATFGEFLTIMSVVFFILDNSFVELPWYVIMGLATIAGALVILFWGSLSKVGACIISFLNNLSKTHK